MASPERRGPVPATQDPAFVEQLYALPRFAAEPGLSRFKALCRPLRDSPWWRDLDALKITGSNGKGTVALLTHAVLEALGVSTGLTTSPHLRRFSERIRLGPLEAEGERLQGAWKWLETRIASAAEPPLVFEAITALALQVFAEARPETVVAEAGIGGRFDPVRSLPGHLAVLVSVDLEHTAILGKTREAIAEDKADLAQDGGELLVGVLDPSLTERIEHHAARREVRVTRLTEVAEWTTPRRAPQGMVFDLTVDGVALPALTLGLVGHHQVENAALAVVAAKRWVEHALESGREVSSRGLAGQRVFGSGGRFEQAARHALVSPKVPGRFERVATGPEVWIDIGHTPAAVRTVADTARWVFEDQAILLVLGVSHDKDAKDIAEALAPVADRVICTRAHHRGGAAERVARPMANLGKPVEVIEPLATAMERAQESARREGQVVLVAGGLFLAIEAAECVAGRDPRALRFY